ncbi:MAG: hypothetical protein L0Y44_16335, partial [Phycisphaerales bacterium]|nr:hypothetical protein [Phycisphaerales bacterium]
MLALTVGVVMAWALGRIVTDRFAWSQWLFWIPTPVVLALCALVLLASLLVRNRVWRKRLLPAGALGASASLLWFLGIEHRFVFSE